MSARTGKNGMSLNESISRCGRWEHRSGVRLIVVRPTGRIVCFIWINSTHAFCTRFRMIDNSESLKSHRNYYSVQQPNFLWHVNYMDKFTSPPHTHTRQRRHYVCTAHGSRETFHWKHSAWRSPVTNELHTTNRHTERGERERHLNRRALFVAWPMCSVRHLIWL